MNVNHTVIGADANQVTPNPVLPDTIDVIGVSSMPPRITQSLTAGTGAISLIDLTQTPATAPFRCSASMAAFCPRNET